MLRYVIVHCDSCAHHVAARIEAGFVADWVEARRAEHAPGGGLVVTVDGEQV